jgi:UDP-glucose 4-epimerase
MSTVFVIGANGFIGRHLVRHLAANGSRVFATARPGATPQAIANVDWVSTDLAADDTSAWPTKCDALVYLAQSARWREFRGGAGDVFRVNVTGIHRAAEHARMVGAKQFIHMSSGTVYTQSKEPACEDEAIAINATRSFYAASKLAAEMLLGPYSAFFKVIQLRLFMPYGVGQNEKMLLPLIASKVREGIAIDLHEPDGLKCNPIAVGDVAEAVRWCLLLEGSHTLNLAGPEVLTLRQVAEAIGSVVGRTPLFNTKPESAPVIVGDTTRLLQVLQWAPPTRFVDGVREWLSAGPEPAAQAREA